MVKDGSVVEYNNKYYLYLGTTKGGRARLISSNGHKFSGTPGIGKLTVVGIREIYTHPNGCEYVSTIQGAFSLASGKLVTNEFMLQATLKS